MLVFWNITLLHNMGTDSAHGDAVWYIVSNQPTIDIMIFGKTISLTPLWTKRKTIVNELQCRSVCSKLTSRLLVRSLLVQHMLILYLCPCLKKNHYIFGDIASTQWHFNTNLPLKVVLQFRSSSSTSMETGESEIVFLLLQIVFRRHEAALDRREEWILCHRLLLWDAWEQTKKFAPCVFTIQAIPTYSHFHVRHTVAGNPFDCESHRCRNLWKKKCVFHIEVTRSEYVLNVTLYAVALAV